MPELSHAESSFQAPRAPGDVACEMSAEAVRIAACIRDQAVWREDASVNWVARTWSTNDKTWSMNPLDSSFFDGLCGTSLFLSAVSKMTAKPEFETLARAALKSVTIAIADHSDQLLRRGIGAGVGAAAAVYSLARIGHLLGDEGFIDAAEELAAFIPFESVQAEPVIDVLTGSAGYLIALLVLYKLRPASAWLLTRAMACGNIILDRRTHATYGLQAWEIQGALQTGFAHGAAGISYALHQLYAATGEKTLLAAAREACEYEDTVYSETHSDWADVLQGSTEPSIFRNRWCRGAPGIGLARLGMLVTTDDDLFRRDAMRSIAKVKSSYPTKLDFPCCGVTGWVELLVFAGQVLHSKSLHEEAIRLAQFVCRRAQLCGRYGLGDDVPPGTPCFHQGLAGIGYELLRVAYPEKLPSALLWE